MDRASNTEEAFLQRKEDFKILHQCQVRKKSGNPLFPGGFIKSSRGKEPESRGVLRTGANAATTGEEGQHSIWIFHKVVSNANYIVFHYTPHRPEVKGMLL